MKQRKLNKTRGSTQGIVFWILSIIFLLSAPVFAHEKTGWVAPNEAKTMKNLVPMTKESLKKGKEIYENRCSMCHGVIGDGKGPTAAPSTPKPTNFYGHRQMKMSGGEFFWKILTRRGVMSSYKKELTEEEIWQVINYISMFGKNN